MTKEVRSSSLETSRAMSDAASWPALTSPNAMVMFAGDTHGQAGWVKHLCRKAQRANCHVINVVGDFGYFPHLEWGERFLADIERHAARYGVIICFEDGNHDNHDWLATLDEFDEYGFAIVSPHVRYVPRGCRWTWSGVSFVALGGAVSVDKADRTEGISWWKDEAIRYQDVHNVCEGGHADVLLSHDAPSAVPVHNKNKDLDPATIANRANLDCVVNEVKPNWVFHGHWHQRLSTRLVLDDGHVVQVESLSRDESMTLGYVIVSLGSLHASA